MKLFLEILGGLGILGLVAGAIVIALFFYVIIRLYIDQANGHNPFL